MGVVKREDQEATHLPLVSLNHVSFVCKSVSRSAKFYVDVLGFVLVKRPSSFNFKGAWLFNYGLGIHLLESNSPDDVPKKKGTINPKDNHISFQSTDVRLVMRKLDAMGIEYVTAIVEEGDIEVEQLFFHDPDGYMVEICNCNKLPVLPLSPATNSALKNNMKVVAQDNSLTSLIEKERSAFMRGRGGERVAQMMERLVEDIMGLPF